MFNIGNDMLVPLDVTEQHKAIISAMGLPKWLGEVPCPHCKKMMGETSFRALSFKLNARNIGDLCVEFICPHCRVGDFLYYRNMFGDINDVNAIVRGDKLPEVVDGVLEDKMYQMNYNNVVDTMIPPNKESPNVNS